VWGASAVSDGARAGPAGSDAVVLLDAGPVALEVLEATDVEERLLGDVVELAVGDLAKASTVSVSGTVEPTTPVNFSAMYVFCERNCWMRRARATTVLSSSDSSSTPRIAMMSWSSLLRCRIDFTRVAAS